MTLWSKSAAHTLRYFHAGYRGDPLQFWLPAANTPLGRLRDLVRNGYLESKPPNLYRITAEGIASLDRR